MSWSLRDRFEECVAEGLAGIPRAELLYYLYEAAAALDALHIQHQMQHLDIKPQHLWLDGARVTIVAVSRNDLEGSKSSVSGGVTPVYAAPETFDGIISRSCDQYSLAIVYQELLTGRRPYRGRNVREIILDHMAGKPDLRPLPLADRPVVGRALSKKPDERFPSCTEFIQALRSALKGV